MCASRNEKCSRLEIEPSGTSVDVSPGDTVLSACLRAGMGMAHECISGGCGKCYFDLIGGEITDLWPEAHGISERARKRGRRLGCQSVPSGHVRMKARLDPKFVPPIRPNRQSGVVVGRRMINHDMCELTLGFDAQRDCLPGQFAMIASDGFAGARAYSMSGAGSDSWQFIVRRVPGGRVSGTLVDETVVGDRLSVDGPYGNAYLRATPARPVVCIGGGSGLSPMISIVRAAATLAPRRPVSLFYGGRRREDLCAELYWRESQVLASVVGLHLAISDPTVPQDEWTGYRGFVHELARDRITPAAAAEGDFYLCGPKLMIDAARAMLQQLGCTPDRIYYDTFY